MKKLFALVALAAVAVCAHAYMSASGPSTPEAQDSMPRGVASAAPVVRAMAQFLEIRQATRAARHPARIAGSPPPDVQTVEDAADQARRTIVEATEREIASHYPPTETGSLLRHYVALVLSVPNADSGSDLSRETVTTDLMADTISTLGDLQATLAAMPAESEGERAALLSLAPRLGADGRTRVATETLLASELARHSGLDSDANELRLTQLVDYFATLEPDSAKQAAFLRAGIQEQEDPRARDALQARLDKLTHLELSQSPDQQPDGGA
jgi:hypothetical protein